MCTCTKLPQRKPRDSPSHLSKAHSSLATPLANVLSLQKAHPCMRCYHGPHTGRGHVASLPVSLSRHSVVLQSSLRGRRGFQPAHLPSAPLAGEKERPVFHSSRSYAYSCSSSHFPSCASSMQCTAISPEALLCALWKSPLILYVCAGTCRPSLARRI